MKTVLFVSIGKLLVTLGGIHRVTNCLMEKFEEYGYKCLYLDSSLDGTTYYTDNIEDNAHKLLPIEVKRYLTLNNVEVIINQQGSFSDSFSKLFRSFELENINLITVFHSSPDIYFKTFTLSRLYSNLINQKGVKSKVGNLIRLVSYPIWKKSAMKGIANMYKNNYMACRYCVMLSENEYPILKKYLGNMSLNKCVTIHNPLTFDEMFAESNIKNKEKCVLIVTRLNNFEKRIDVALKIWRIIEDKGFYDWHLYIVGYGIHEQDLQSLSYKLKLKNVHFEGMQESEQYYERASIFMMTSAIEGWGLTITESMQFGAVPIAFDSYPALRDIINDGYDGIVIPECDIVYYANKLSQLIQDDDMREQLAKNGLKSCQRFEINKIVGQWIKLMN